MADGVFNIAKGKVNEYMSRVVNNDPAAGTIVVVLFKVSEADGTLEDYDLLSTLIAGANTEADFTNYARKVLDDTALSAYDPSPDDTNNKQNADLPDQTWTSAGGATNNTMTKLIVCYDPSSSGVTDSVMVPLTHHDFTPTTDGSDLTAQFHADGFYSAA